jgi:subtilisin-like proprotein convertase family protein
MPPNTRMMPTTLIKPVFLTLACAGWLPCAEAQWLTNTISSTPNASISDASPAGWKDQFTVGGMPGTIASVKISLDISGGYNGDLYAFLSAPQGELAVLLNRPGITAANPFGYSDAGFSITLDTGASGNIHDYGISYSLNGRGMVTGTWLADGRNIDPQSDGLTFDQASTGAGLGVFNGLSGEGLNGTWTLFVGDFAGGGGSPTLESFHVEIVAVPEPGAVALAAIGGWLLLLYRRRSHA